MKGWGQVAVLVLLVSGWAVAQGTGGGANEVKDLQVKVEGANVAIEVTLSAGVQPSVETAVKPDRLVLTLPGALSSARQKRIVVHASGVRDVRMGLHSAEPPVTRVVVDLDRAQPYTIVTQGNTVILRVQPAETTGRRVPPAAASAPILGSVFHRTPPPPAQPESQTSAQNSLPPPPPSLPPIQFPPEQAQNKPPSAKPSASTTPSASHPKLGSLQQGTVFPSMGVPGEGTVPPVANPQNVGFGQNASQSAGAQPPPAPAPSTTPPAPSMAPASPAAVAGAATAPTTIVASAPAQATTDSSPAANVTTPAPSASTAAAPPASTVAPAAATNTTQAATSATTPEVATVANPLAGVKLYPVEAQPVEAVETQPADSQVSSATATPPQRTTGTAPQGQPSSTDSSSSGSAGQAVEVAKAEAPRAAVIPELAIRRANPDFRISFKVKYVASGAAYLDGGRAAGLAEGMKLTVRDTPNGPVAAPADGSDPTAVAELEVVSVAETSAVTDIHNPKRDVKTGDLAYLSVDEQEALVQKSALSSTRKYPTVIAFTEGDTLDDEVRAEVPRPPMPSVNRARGRIGVDYMGTVSHGVGGGTNSNLGLVARLDITRLNGTYWNVSGYWRGRLSSSSYTGQQTIQDLINRTYHLSMMYDNPNSAWVAGFGRMYLPWATSLDTIDGGYFGRRLGHGSTLGIFAGSTPDPTSYSYNPNQEIAGSFINFEGGSFDNFKYTSTSGAGVTMLKWNVQKPFVFFENGFFYKRYFSLYDALQVDSPSGNQAVASPGLGVGRNFLTARFMPHPRLEFNASYNYFRDIPTFDPTLIGTGLLDKFLFQGFSGGVRVETVKQVWLYTDIGRSNRSGDANSSLNQLYGITFGKVPWVKIRADAHYSRFNSSFGSGSYEAVSLSRNLNDAMHFELLLGEQRFNSQFTSNNQSKFVTTNLDMNLGLHYFLQGGFTVSRGPTMNYDQWMFTLGYRFDSKRFKAQ